MRLLIGLVLLASGFQNIYGQDRATLQGEIRSLDGSLLPEANVTIKPWSSDQLFSTREMYTGPEGNFEAQFNRPGLYRVTVQGVLHKDLQFPLWIRNPDTLQVSIKLDPKNLDDGEYFNKDEYLSWIRVTGNFNGYNYDNGIPFKRLGPKTLGATIRTGLDTLRYQIVGITSGTTVLPGAHSYRMRDSDNFEAVIPVEDNKVELTYYADSTYFRDMNPYDGYRTTWDPYQGSFTFTLPHENKIHHNLNTRYDFYRVFNLEVLSSDSLTTDQFEAYMADVYDKLYESYRIELISMEPELSYTSGNISPYQLQSTYLKYLFLAHRTNENRQRRPEPNGETESSFRVDSKIIAALMEKLPPSSPLWSLEQELILALPEFLGHTPKVISYLKQAALSHSDNNLTGRLLLYLFRWSYDNTGNSEQTQQYYRYIMDQFGDNYYARKAREYVQNNR